MGLSDEFSLTVTADWCMMVFMMNTMNGWHILALTITADMILRYQIRAEATDRLVAKWVSCAGSDYARALRVIASDSATGPQDDAACSEMSRAMRSLRMYGGRVAKAASRQFAA